MRLVTPLSYQSAVKVDQFLDAETRLISARAYEEELTQESSWRIGVRFQLPLDGLANVSSILPATDADADRSNLFSLLKPVRISCDDHCSQKFESGYLPRRFLIRRTFDQVM